MHLKRKNAFMFPYRRLYFYQIIFLFFILFVHSVEVAYEIEGSCDSNGRSIAVSHNCTYLEQIGSLDHKCLMDCPDGNPVLNYPSRMKRDTRILWYEKQVALVRKKREVPQEISLNDPEWNDMWYLNRGQYQNHFPDHNVTAAWAMGYTGKGVVLTFLDDGLEYTHPDINQNYDPLASFDVNDNDTDPFPRYDSSNENKHGTRCAGEVAAVANNSNCIVGVAYDSKVGGIRMLDGQISDRVEAASLSYRPDHIHIYSASWGPSDDGKTVDGPGKLAADALYNGITKGRQGKGSIFVWASGNGGRDGDSCACDGYINSIYTFAISATTEVGDQPWYHEECPGALATAYSSGDTERKDKSIVTIDLKSSCTKDHTGTSAAAPLAAAFIALVLEARPDLTWRDVMYICVLGSKPDDIKTNAFIVNGAGFKVSNKYGFGLLNAGLMVYLATQWVLVPPMLTCESRLHNVSRSIAGYRSYETSLNFKACLYGNKEINYIEQVQIYVTAESDSRGTLEIYVTSPSNTRSKILPTRRNDKSPGKFENWPFLSLHFWGENPYGVWKLRVVNTATFNSKLISWRIVVHGTKQTLNRIRSRSPATCHLLCDENFQPCGPTKMDCAECKFFRHPTTGECVPSCPVGWYGSHNKLCLPCHENCRHCMNGLRTGCLSCHNNHSLLTDLRQCVKTCPAHYYHFKQLSICIKCAEACLTCNEYGDYCFSCAANYTLSGHSCIPWKNCKSNQYFDVLSNRCEFCHPTCRTCTGDSPSLCSSCKLESLFRFLHHNSCLPTCPEGYFANPYTLTCTRCMENCKFCDSQYTCSTCDDGYVKCPSSCCLEQLPGYLKRKLSPFTQILAIVVVFIFIVIFIALRNHGFANLAYKFSFLKAPNVYTSFPLRYQVIAGQQKIKCRNSRHFLPAVRVKTDIYHSQ